MVVFETPPLSLMIAMIFAILPVCVCGVVVQRYEIVGRYARYSVYIYIFLIQIMLGMGIIGIFSFWDIWDIGLSGCRIGILVAVLSEYLHICIFCLVVYVYSGYCGYFVFVVCVSSSAFADLLCGMRFFLLLLLFCFVVYAFIWDFWLFQCVGTCFFV